MTTTHTPTATTAEWLMHAALHVTAQRPDLFPTYGADLFDVCAVLIGDSPTFRDLALRSLQIITNGTVTEVTDQADWTRAQKLLLDEADTDRRAAARWPDPFAGLPRR